MRAIVKTTIEALEARGFSKAESLQIVRRIQDGNDESLTITSKNIEIDSAYNRGYADGKKAYIDEMIRRQDEALRRMREQYQSTVSSPLYSGLGGGIGAGLFTNCYTDIK